MAVYLVDSWTRRHLMSPICRPSYRQGRRYSFLQITHPFDTASPVILQGHRSGRSAGKTVHSGPATVRHNYLGTTPFGTTSFRHSCPLKCLPFIGIYPSPGLPLSSTGFSRHPPGPQVWEWSCFCNERLDSEPLEGNCSTGELDRGTTPFKATIPFRGTRPEEFYPSRGVILHQGTFQMAGSLKGYSLKVLHIVHGTTYGDVTMSHVYGSIMSCHVHDDPCMRMIHVWGGLIHSMLWPGLRSKSS